MYRSARRSLLLVIFVILLCGFLGVVLSGGGQWPILVVVSIAGLAGSLVDSLLGATLQAIYFCPLDQKETEKHPLHSCGTRTEQVRGLGWMNNDMVNFACSVVGAMVVLLLAS